MTLPYKVYTVCRRALEDVYSSKGGSLRMGGDFRCFHLDVAGFYRLLEMMVAFGPVSYTHLRAHETVLDLVGSEMCIRDSIRKGALYSVEPADGSVPSVV